MVLVVVATLGTTTRPVVDMDVVGGAFVDVGTAAVAEAYEGPCAADIDTSLADSVVEDMVASDRPCEAGSSQDRADGACLAAWANMGDHAVVSRDMPAAAHRATWNGGSS